MSEIPLISQGDGFVYNALIAGMGASFTGSNVFTWPGPNVWYRVPLLSAMPGPTSSPPFQYSTPDGGFKPPIAGWWQITVEARCYAGSGLWSHWAGLFLNSELQVPFYKIGGWRAIQINGSVNVYLNGNDTVYMQFLTTRTGISTRNFSASQTYIQAHYLRP